MLAESLEYFSLDVVGLVASYLVFGVASKDAKPKTLCDVKSDGSEFNTPCLGITTKRRQLNLGHI